MNKSHKYIRKLSPHERDVLQQIIEKIKSGDVFGLDIKKLKGYNNSFRVRKGKHRIIFHLDMNGMTIIDDVVRRDDNTY